MSFSELYKRKLMTAEEAVRKIHSHDEIVVAVAALVGLIVFLKKRAK